MPEPFAPEQPHVRERLLLDFGWRFHLGHACDPGKDFGFGADQRTFAKSGAGVAPGAALDFDDSGWAAVDLPHDWAVELPFVPDENPPPGQQNDERASHGYKPLGRSYPDTSVGWYRRSFDVPGSDLGRRLWLEFDGVFRDAIVVFNEYVLARNQSGYAPFRVDITDFTNYGGKNILALRVDATLGEGWFYEGAGIYRHVWLVKTNALHIPQWGTWVRSDLEGAVAHLTIATEIVNQDAVGRDCDLVSTVVDPTGRVVATASTHSLAIRANENRTVVQRAVVRRPSLWSLETPNLYHVTNQVIAEGKLVDATNTRFGIRTAKFDPDRGFLLNGEPVRILGTCNHQDHAGVGSALPDGLQDFRVAKLKQMGSNAYRTSHNAPTPELLDACDRLGMLVLDETRRMASDPGSLDEFARMIRRDRNHPSVVIWSLGNEEWAEQVSGRGARVAASMKQLVREIDPTRPITAAVNDSHFPQEGVAPVLDVMGCNYNTDAMIDYHRRVPRQPILATETASTVSTRGVYVRDADSGYCVAYDLEAPPWAYTAETWWNAVAPHKAICGGFVWTGFDYRGEPTPFNCWPNVSSQFGCLDSCGFPKDNYFYYKAWWGGEPVLHLFPHWNWQGKAGQKINVWCHTNLDEVELFLNGQSQGVRSVVPYRHVEWDVPYAPGAVEARGYKNGRLVLTDRRETTGLASKISLRPSQPSLEANGEDVAVVEVQVVDSAGRLIPTADDNVSFSITGAAAIIGVGNGDPRSHEPDKAMSRSVFNGLCTVILKAMKIPGDVVLTAAAPGLQEGSLSLAVLPAVPRPCVT